jgi:hypothetical protein
MSRTIRIDELSDGRYLAVDECGRGYYGDSPTATFEALWGNGTPQTEATYPPAGRSRNPMAHVGIFKDNPMFDDWVAAIAENRRIQDEEEARRDAEIESGPERTMP